MRKSINEGRGHMKKLICLLLVCVLSCAMLFACTDEEDDKKDDGGDTVGSLETGEDPEKDDINWDIFN